MSLRGRLLVIIVLLNLAVIGVVQVTALWAHRERAAAQRDLYQELLESLVQATGLRDGIIDTRWVRKLLGLESFRRVFRDVMVTTGGFGRTVDLNPMGAAHRDLDSFALDEVRSGIRAAVEQRRTVPVAGGFCVPIKAGDRFAAGAWYVPVEVGETLPLRYFAIPVLLSAAVIGVLAFYGIGRSVVNPLRGLGRAAARVGAGEYGVRVVPVPGAIELNALVDAFNAMAAKVAGHTDELRREVQRATEEAARRERALVVSSRLAAMGTLAAGIAHEINNPIGGMINAVHRLLQRDDLDDRSRTYLELVLEGLERVAAIARRVLDFSPRQLDAAPFDLAAAIEGARALVEHRCVQAGVELRIDLAEDLPAIVGDRHEMQQVLLNFFLNSLDVLEEGEEPRWIAVRGVRTDDGVHLAVQDSGPGADEETLARAMDPFFSAKDRPDASGLGLFISYSIITNHGGEMELSAPPGEGFCIDIRLPVAGNGSLPQAGA